MAEERRWLWDSGAGRLGQYRDSATGYLLSDDEVQGVLNGIIDQANGDQVETLSTMLEDGRLSAEAYAIAFALLIEILYIQQAELGAGGRDQMTPALWALILGGLAIQYGFLERFAQQIKDGQLTAGQISARAKMYINSSRESFWMMRDEEAKRTGKTEERWIDEGDSNVCGPCSDAGAMGWQPIGTFSQPGSGRVMNRPRTNCQGLTNCRCEKEYR